MRASELIPLIGKKCQVRILGGRYGTAGGSFFGYSGEETEREMRLNEDALIRNIWRVGFRAVRIVCDDFPCMCSSNRRRKHAGPKDLLFRLESWEKKYGEPFLSEEGRRRLEQYKNAPIKKEDEATKLKRLKKDNAELRKKVKELKARVAKKDNALSVVESCFSEWLGENELSLLKDSGKYETIMLWLKAGKEA